MSSNWTVFITTYANQSEAWALIDQSELEKRSRMKNWTLESKNIFRLGNRLITGSKLRRITGLNPFLSDLDSKI